MCCGFRRGDGRSKGWGTVMSMCVFVLRWKRGGVESLKAEPWQLRGKHVWGMFVLHLPPECSCVHCPFPRTPDTADALAARPSSNPSATAKGAPMFTFPKIHFFFFLTRIHPKSYLCLGSRQGKSGCNLAEGDVLCWQLITFSFPACPEA